MTTQRYFNTETTLFSASGRELPTLACDAALELDNLILGKRPQVASIRRLADVLTKKDALLLDPTTVMVMCLAISDAEPEAQLTSTEDVVGETGEFGVELNKVASDPTNASPDVLTRLRQYCLALSERASGNEQLLDDWEPQHPWKR